MKSRTITFAPELEAIIKRCETCVVAMTDPEGFPYALPMNFGWNDGVVYLHSAPQGKKIDFLKAKPEVCLDSIMQQYGAKDYKYSEPAIRNVCVMKIVAEKIEGRVYGY